MKQLAVFSLFFTFLFYGCTHEHHASENFARAKITFESDQLDSNGLYGPDDGKHSLTYEFCIPANVDYAQQVMSIDQTALVYRKSPGRVQCGYDEYLVTGETHQPEFRTVLKKLANLEYVSKISEAHFE